MATLAFDPSTLKVFYNGTSRKAKTQCCDVCAVGSDCCCFLDPTTPTWDSGTQYNVDELVEYSSKTYESRENGNINNQPDTSPSSWLKVSDIVSCGNGTWDDYPPFGGPGATPQYYTVTLSGLSFCGGESCWPFDEGCINPIDANGTYKLTNAGACAWQSEDITGDCEGGAVRARLTLQLGAGARIYFRVIDPSNCFFSALFVAFDAEIDTCELSGSVANTTVCGVAPAIYEDGTATWSPGWSG